jgi:hypothetical protein
MAYVPDWERLSDALSRVIAAGISKPEAKRDICRAIADRKIRIRVQPAKAEIPDAKWFGPAVGSNVAIPRDLSPRDLDWRKSLPKRPWQHGDHPFVQLHLSLIELFSAHVTLLFCAGSRVPERPTKGNLSARTQRARGKNPPGNQKTQSRIAEPTFDPSGRITRAEPILAERGSAGAGNRDLGPIPPKSAPDTSDVRKQARIWRANRIERFTARQRWVRQWINFAEIAEWCSKEDRSIVPNEEKRAAAFDTLQTDLLAGEFDDYGRSRVLYLHPSTTKSRITRLWLIDVIDNNYDGHRGRAHYL